MICGSPIAGAPIAAHGLPWDATFDVVATCPLPLRPSAFSSTAEKARARQVLTALGGCLVFNGAAGVVVSVGYVDQASDFLGLDTPISDARFVASMLVEDVGAPQRGDAITDEDGDEWVVHEEVPGSDPWVTDWTVSRR